MEDLAAWALEKQATCFIGSSPRPPASTSRLKPYLQAQRDGPSPVIHVRPGASRRAHHPSTGLELAVSPSNVICSSLHSVEQGSRSTNGRHLRWLAQHASASFRPGSLSGPDVFVPSWREDGHSILHCHADDHKPGNLELWTWAKARGPPGYIAVQVPVVLAKLS